MTRYDRITEYLSERNREWSRAPAIILQVFPSDFSSWGLRQVVSSPSPSRPPLAMPAGHHPALVSQEECMELAHYNLGENR